MIPRFAGGGSEGRNYTSRKRRSDPALQPRSFARGERRHSVHTWELSRAMAVPHFSVSIVARGRGASAVLSAAYRHCARMAYEREARTIDYTRKQGLLHEEFAIPADAPDWLRTMIADRSVASSSEAFWNKVEDFEKRSDAQLAKDVTIALPVELSADENIALVREFVTRHITAKGMVADWVFHDAPGNPHIHLMTTLRPLSDAGFGPKKVPVLDVDGRVRRNEAGKTVYALWAGGVEDFNTFRDGWFACQNRHLALAGLDVRVDGRSFEKQGIALSPTIHLGVGTKAIARKAERADEKAVLDRLELQEERRAENARRIGRNPEILLGLITREKSVFDERDVAKILHRYIDDAELFQSLMARVLQNPGVLRLDRERLQFGTGGRVPAKYTTRELIRLEAEMAARAVWLSRQSSHGVKKALLEARFARHDRLSDEQRAAIWHVAGGTRIAAVIGRAGAGKTTMMKAACEAWQLAGYRVVGGALAGKAAEGLEKEAGIASRTLASWELRWDQGRDLLDRKTIFVLDEAGMVSSWQMAKLVEAVSRTGAKLVLVGDPEQLQPIEAGAAFRAITERIGYAELETIYRQGAQWMRDASLELARGNVGAAVSAYEARGRIIGTDKKADAVLKLVSDWDRDYDPTKSTLILAHLRRDVRMLNELARARLVERGLVDEGLPFKTVDGIRRFAAGDQIVFLRNETALGVKNGMLGRVIDAAPGRILVVTGDGRHGVAGSQVMVEQRFYNDLDHGYATTVHKAQGATVDRVKVLASLSLDRHLTYVAMTRHREDLSLYYGRMSFLRAGGLAEILSRRNAKETTLDYAGSSFYRQALRFAEARGLHLLQVARSIVRDRLEWTVAQGSRLAALAGRLSAIGARLGRLASLSTADPGQRLQPGPLVSGVTVHALSVAQAVEEKLVADPVIKHLWEEVSRRFHLVYAQPEAAFRDVDFEAMLRDRGRAQVTIARIVSEPQAFGDLRGKTGIFASGGERVERQRAVQNVRVLAESVGDYLRHRYERHRRYMAEVLSERERAAVEIPALSAEARQVLERVRDAIEREGLDKAVKQAEVDSGVRSELEGFAKAVAARFGERSLLPLAAGDAKGAVFARLTSGLNPGQRLEVEKAWALMRTVQQLAAHQRSADALKASQGMRATKGKELSLK